MRSGLRQNRGKTDGWAVAAMATPDVTHPRGLWAGHAPRSAEAPSFVSLSVYACAVGVEGGGGRLRQEGQGSDGRGMGQDEVCRAGGGGNGAGRAPECGGFDRAQVLGWHCQRGSHRVIFLPK